MTLPRPLPGRIRRAIDWLIIDARNLALLRVGVGLLMLITALMQLPQFETLYGDRGLLPRSLLLAVDGDWRLSLYYLNAQTGLLIGLALLELVAALALIMGRHSRLAAWLLLVLILSRLHRNPLAVLPTDPWLLLLLPTLALLPVERRGSLTALLGSTAGDGPGAPVTGFALRLWTLAFIAALLGARLPISAGSLALSVLALLPWLPTIVHRRLGRPTAGTEALRLYVDERRPGDAKLARAMLDLLGLTPVQIHGGIESPRVRALQPRGEWVLIDADDRAHRGREAWRLLQRASPWPTPLLAPAVSIAPRLEGLMRRLLSQATAQTTSAHGVGRWGAGSWTLLLLISLPILLGVSAPIPGASRLLGVEAVPPAVPLPLVEAVGQDGATRELPAPGQGSRTTRYWQDLATARGTPYREAALYWLCAAPVSGTPARLTLSARVPTRTGLELQRLASVDCPDLPQ